MPNVYKILGQSVPTGTSSTTLYTVPNTSTNTVVSSVSICNTTSAPATAYLYVVRGGGTAGTSNAVLFNVTVPAESSTTYSNGITISNTSGVVDFIVCGTDTSGALTFQAWGSEIS